MLAFCLCLCYNVLIMGSPALLPVTPENVPSAPTLEMLSSQIVSLPDSYVVAGSLGRCIVMGAMDLPLTRKVGLRDIDVIDSVADSAIPTPEPMPFRVDKSLERFLRP